MIAKVFIGNLSYDAGDHDIRSAFSEFGGIQSISIPTDRDTGNPRGFAFLEFGTPEEAQAAIDAMNGAVICGRKINVSIARPKEGGGGSRQGGGRRDSRRGQDEY